MKIETSKIEGYENMTPEQKVAALEAYEYEDNKNLLSMRNAEIAKQKTKIAEIQQQLNDKMTADEKAAAEREAKEKADADELKSLRRELAVSKNAAKYIALGYTQENAKKTAEALADGDLETVFAMQEGFTKTLKDNLQAELLQGAKGPEGKHKDSDPDFDKMSDKEYYEYLRRNKDGK